MSKKIGSALTVVALLASTQALATAYQLPAADESVIGDIQYAVTTPDDSAPKIGQRYDVGYNAIANANPQVSDPSKNIPSGIQLQIPTQHLLPNEARKGIVINLPEMRMYYYPEGSNEVLTYPIGIGKIGKTIPIKQTHVVRKAKDPVWIPPEDIRQFNLDQGIVLPRVMPAGPDNPLGPYAIYTGIPTYLMHSTPFSESIGKRASFGCIRMYQSDIEGFFPSIKSGIPIAITNKPVKLGWQKDHLYIEAYAPLEEHGDAFDASLPGMVHMISQQTENADTLVDWQQVAYIAKERDGIPHDVAMKISQ